MGEDVKELARRYGYRPYMVGRYLEILGDLKEVEELLEAFEKALRPSIRCNKLKLADCRELIERLEKMGFLLERIGWCSEAYEVLREPEKPSLGSTHEHLIGLYYLYRGKASLIPPITLKPGERDEVLDMAAAPGGKTTHMAQIMRNKGLIVALEPDEGRLRVLRNNVERLGVKNTVLLRLDGREAGKVFRKTFTKALLDAPCTGEGIIMLDPSRKTKTSLEDLVKHHEIQKELLRSALDSLKGGGRILYTTCSIAPEENELVLNEVIKGRDDVRVLSLETPVKLSPPVTEYYGIRVDERIRYCGRTYPHVHGMEGFFICLMELK
ncbi:MAG: RsmB/NOP family class I SAM-dependent RNA methyltransferase [Desulfurococcaceae archaeon]|nr:RsmB/NOP family class I SAM-dependent RNA methyltransferase [Desulfurococcaceae archaeon]